MTTMEQKRKATAERLGVPPELMPRHLAIIMDGNGRWAQRQGLPRYEGHGQGAKTAAPLDTLRPVVLEVCRKAGKALPAGVLVAQVKDAAKIGEKRAAALIQLMEEDGAIASTPRLSQQGGEVRRGLPEQVAEYLKPRLPLGKQ